MTLKELRSTFTTGLSGNYPAEEIQSFFSWLAESYLGYSRFEVSMNLNETVPDEVQTKFSEALIRLKKHEPIQYILGETEFYGLPIRVSPATLIPRPETEELVQWVIGNSREKLPNLTKLNVLDIGTGSGCIAISLAKYLKNASVSALDISEEAIVVAKENALLNDVAVNFQQADILAIKHLPQQYDIIISNPPYVRELEKKHMLPNVLAHEPETALFVSDKAPLLFYEQIAALASTSLTPSGTLYFEINEYLSEEMHQMLQEKGFSEIELKKDLFGKFRMLKCKLTS
ncbi:MAG TPA: peptide chain release factor N(5)-glutamine methyltransferase [Flavobacteriaceae bacterium]|nr:protein-(glutamine-N5) methyltransferase, release factor-specific [Flavobacteriaceae bacterium]MAY53376.1 protein-(glutamine-N5) methyltransferase, release factor-specific [Flavobacteriaceae bacterium]HBR54315.1 peptide chain release factor N(5)-glutamine methyltransferase [Flavobacteriaceae bacterium]